METDISTDIRTAMSGVTIIYLIIDIIRIDAHHPQYHHTQAEGMYRVPPTATITQIDTATDYHSMQTRRVMA